MFCTFVLGLILGWLVWRFGTNSQQARDAADTEVEFWRNKLEQSRQELWSEQSTIAELREEKNVLKKRIASLET